MLLGMRDTHQLGLLQETGCMKICQTHSKYFALLSLRSFKGQSRIIVVSMVSYLLGLKSENKH